ncbi:MAG: PAS domain-containing protein [Spirochaetia bacterium]|jgi:PAS domain S-box-containing protein
MDTSGEARGDNLAADDLQEIVALCDEDGILLSWNRAGEEITGFAREDVVGYHLDAIIAPDSRQMLGEMLGFQRTGSLLPGLPVKLQTSFGWEVPAEVTSVPRRINDSAMGWLLIFRDTTLKVQLQEQLDRMDVLYRGLVENSPDIVYVLDEKAKVLFINDTVETLLGYSKKDLIGRELIELVHPEDRQHAYWPLRERRRADRATRNLRLRLLTRAGRPRRYDLEFLYVSLFSYGLGESRRHTKGAAGEESLGTQGVARDVTELILLQEFSRQAELILPMCSVCRRIRVTTGATVEWIPLADYIARKTGVLYSHTFCPDHLPSSL